MKYRVNYEVNEKGIIQKWVRIPFNENLPWIAVDDPKNIKIGFDKVIDGKLVPDNIAYTAYVERNKLIEKKQNRIRELKNKLCSTDYMTLKFIDGVIAANEYELIKKERQDMRDEINSIEKELEALK